MTDDEALKLFEEFEESIMYDPKHSLEISVRRSEAGRRILDRKREILPALARYLRDYTPSVPAFKRWANDLKYAWGLLLTRMSHELHLRELPSSTDDVRWWATQLESLLERTL